MSSRKSDSLEGSDPAESLIGAVADQNAIDVAADVAEIALDSFLSESVLREIPILGTLVGLSRAGIGIRDRLFARKIAQFLKEIGEVPSETREAFVTRLDQDPGFRRKVGE